jgi:uncharacterized protein (TIGR00369 family)
MNSVIRFLQSRIGKKPASYMPPVTRWLDGTLKEVKKGAITAAFVVGPEMANPVGLLHGGIQNAIIDDVIGMTVATLGKGGFCLSVNLYVDYLGKASIGDLITARSTILRKGKQMLNVQCELLDANGDIIARGISNLVRSKIPAYEPERMLPH